jgi:NADPH:quinone reductase-like Zn-dependent oxidoreductase
MTMHAVRFHDYKGLDGLRYEEAPIPTAGAGEVLIAVHAAGVNPFDWYAVEGYVNQFVQFDLPAVLGRDVSGVVEAVGPGVDGFAVGDAVYGQADPVSHGAFADYTAVAAQRLAKKPAVLSHVEAAALPNVLIAAWDGLFSPTSGANLEAGQTVLIHGAAGGIGSIAVQLAKWRGANIIGTASAANLSFLHELGAKQVFDYTVPGWTSEVGRVDAVIDTSDGQAAKALCALIKRGGRYVGFRGAGDPDFQAEQAAAGVTCLGASGPASLGDFPKMAALVEQGAIKPVVSATYPVTAVREALERVRDGHVRGKIVLTIRG